MTRSSPHGSVEEEDFLNIVNSFALTKILIHERDVLTRPPQGPDIAFITNLLNELGPPRQLSVGVVAFKELLTV